MHLPGPTHRCGRAMEAAAPATSDGQHGDGAQEGKPGLRRRPLSHGHESSRSSLQRGSRVQLERARALRLFTAPRLTARGPERLESALTPRRGRACDFRDATSLRAAARRGSAPLLIAGFVTSLIRTAAQAPAPTTPDRGRRCRAHPRAGGGGRRPASRLQRPHRRRRRRGPPRSASCAWTARPSAGSRFQPDRHRRQRPRASRPSTPGSPTFAKAAGGALLSSVAATRSRRARPASSCRSTSRPAIDFTRGRAALRRAVLEPALQRRQAPGARRSASPAIPAGSRSTRTAARRGRRRGGRRAYSRRSRGVADLVDAAAEEQAALAGTRGFEPPGAHPRPTASSPTASASPYHGCGRRPAAGGRPAGTDRRWPARRSVSRATAGLDPGRGHRTGRPALPHARRARCSPPPTCSTILDQARAADGTHPRGHPPAARAAARASRSRWSTRRRRARLLPNADAPVRRSTSPRRRRAPRYFFSTRRGRGAARLRNAGATLTTCGSRRRSTAAWPSRRAPWASWPSRSSRPGIDDSARGPFSTPSPIQTWSVFNTGLQLDLIKGGRAHFELRARRAAPPQPNGITIFPGGVPLYQGRPAGRRASASAATASTRTTSSPRRARSASRPPPERALRPA